MLTKKVVQTHTAPAALGPYSQAVITNNTVYLSGQLPLIPTTMELVTHSMQAQVEQVFKNLSAVSEAAGGSLAHIVKLTIFLTDLTHFSIINDIMMRLFTEPYPARSTIEVSALPKGAAVEIEAIMLLPN